MINIIKSMLIISCSLLVGCTAVVVPVDDGYYYNDNDYDYGYVTSDDYYPYYPGNISLFYSNSYYPYHHYQGYHNYYGGHHYPSYSHFNSNFRMHGGSYSYSGHHFGGYSSGRHH